MSRPEPEVLRAGSIPEVRAFLKQQRALQEWKERFPGAARALEAIAGPYNTSLKAAAETVKARKATCPPFFVESIALNRGWAERFANAVGRIDFVRFGGDIRPTEVFEMESARFEGVCDREHLSDELVARVADWVPRYGKPAEISLP